MRYLQHVADRFDLRSDIQFSTRVAAAAWDATASRWQLRTSRGDQLCCRYFVMATGCLSVPKEIDITGTERFAGPTYVTGRWPHESVDFTGLRVAVIGTGSSGIQAIPLIAEQAAAVTVFQRTPSYSMPARNGPVPADRRALLEHDRAAFRRAARHSPSGVPMEWSTESAMAVTEAERRARYEAAWAEGGLDFIRAYADHLTNEAANDAAAGFVRDKIRSIVRDPATAELLCPRTYPIGTKRPCLDTGYYETFNRPHVRLVDLRAHPIATITESGIDLDDESLDFDAIVFATGFDAMTGAVVAVDIEGRDGATLKAAWARGALTYLGLMVHGFPNLFLVTGPGSPSVLSNMAVSIEQHVEWITACLADLRDGRFDTIEPTEDAVAGWVRHVTDFADLTLAPRADSWYVGANVPGKPRVYLPYVGGVGRYRAICERAVGADYLGFERRGPAGVRRTEGTICAVAPDVMIMLESRAALDLPAIDSLSVADARAFTEAVAARRPAGPDVGQIIDATLPGMVGELAYRLYRPTGPGPHRIVVYFHGGGWMLGGATADDPFCRDLCARAGTVVISVDYRHAPEHRFPAAPADALAAVRWVVAHAAELGGRPGPIAVAGWGAGANLAAVVCHQARDGGGPEIAGQLLVTPATDHDLSRPSYTDNADGYILTTALVSWFWDHYADGAQRLSLIHI